MYYKIITQLKNMDSGEISSIVTIVGLGFSYFGITGIDSSVVTGAINGLIAVVTFGAALWSWYSHRQKNSTS
jgi:hypothetical protein